MTTRARPVDRAVDRIETDLIRLRNDLRAARRAAGLSHDAVAGASGVAGSTAARIELGESRQPDLRVLARMAAAVGLELRLRAYPAGDPIRDAGQQRLLVRFHARLHRDLRWRTEVALPNDRDLRAWDGVVIGAGWRAAVEAETVLDDIQAVERRIALKVRDGEISVVIIVVADTTRNRRALRSAPAAFGGLSRNARGTLAALARGDRPPGSAVILL